MTADPSFEDIFAVMAAASVGESTARVPVPDEPKLEDLATRFAIALNVLLDDLATRAAEAQRSARAAATAAAKDQFLATMSHEIRTPLHGVLGMTSVVLTTELTLDQREMMETVRRSGFHLMTILDDVLDFSRIEANRLTLDWTVLDVRQCIEEAIELVAPKADEKKLQLLYLVDPAVPRQIMGDAGRLRQILLNLVSNAVKFTQEGEVLVNLDTRVLEDGRHELHFRVEDSGIGIAPAEMRGLFQPFSQAESGAARRHGGAGLGLAISKRLCEMMGGRIWVTSELGRGSTFEFTIVTTVAPGGDAPAAAPPPELAHRVLLIVDDNATSRRVLSRQLESWGMTPQTSASASEGLDRIAQGESFDAILLDHSPPGVDAAILARAIRRYRGPNELPIVLLVGLSVRREPLTVGDLAVAAILTKPVRASQLFNALLGIFAPTEAEARSAARAPPVDALMASRHPLRILVVEDNLVNQRVAAALLSRFGYRPDIVPDGESALDAVAANDYDLVFMDLHMPGIDGFETTQRMLARTPQSKRPRILAMTADVLPSEQKRCFEVGMSGYVSKPVSIEKIGKILHDVVRA